jgi:hypothetical protein
MFRKLWGASAASNTLDAVWMITGKKESADSGIAPASLG